MQRLEHRLQLGRTHLPIEFRRERLQVHRDRIHKLEQRKKRLLVDQSVGVIQHLQPPVLRQPGDVEHILVEHRGFAVRERHRLATMFHSQLDHFLRCQLVILRLLHAPLGDVPVVTELTAIVKACGCRAEDPRAG